MLCCGVFMLYCPYLSRQVFQAQSQALLQRCAAGIAEDDGVWVDVDAVGVDACAFRLDECYALLHRAVFLRSLDISLAL
jgi:hypothetical protein